MMAARRLLGAAMTIAVVGVGFAGPAAAVSTSAPATVFSVSGTQTFHPPPFPDQLLPGFFAGDVVDRISYPAAIFGMDSSIAIAVSGLTAGVQSTTGPTILAGYSQGAIAVAYEKKRIMALPADQRPAADRLTFVTLGDPSGPSGILRFLPFSVPLLDLTPFTPPDTPYNSVIVNGQYDGWGDFPDRPWNLISLANALLGIPYVHGRYEVIPGGLDLSAVPAKNITVTANSLGGTTTSYLIPTPNLPLLQPLRDIGIPGPIVDALQTSLKPIVDAGYTRNDAKPAAVSPSGQAPSAKPLTSRSPVRAQQRSAAPAAPTRAAAAARRSLATA